MPTPIGPLPALFPDSVARPSSVLELPVLLPLFAPIAARPPLPVSSLENRPMALRRPASPKPKDRVYRAGFGVAGAPVEEPVPLVAVGGRYVMPDLKNNEVVLEMPAAPNAQTNNARIRFSDAGDLENRTGGPCGPPAQLRRL